MEGISSAIILGVIGSLLAAGLIWYGSRHIGKVQLLLNSLRLAMHLKKGGMTRFHFSREDYLYRLPQYLATAKHDITIISISLKLTSAEGSLISFFENRLANQSDFDICISLIKPESNAANAAAASLGIPVDQLNAEVRSMLSELIELKTRLPNAQARRLEILVHECMPMGSAILLDAQHGHGEIQVETKLYKSPRTESFGYIVSQGSQFYQRNYHSWTQVIDDSSLPTTIDLGHDE